MRSYGTEPVIWGGSPDCDHQLTESPAGKVLTGGTGTASAKQVTNAGSQYGNAWSETIPFAGSIAGNKTPSGFQQSSAAAHAGALSQIQGHPNGSGQICTRCGAWRGELGSEPIPDCLGVLRGEPPCSICFVCHIVTVFRAVRRVLHPTGTVFCNLGDSYTTGGSTAPRASDPKAVGDVSNGIARVGSPMGLGPKQLMMLPARVALALQADGWVLRSDITWGKLAPMPESVRDRPTNATEHIFLLAKNPTYFYDQEAVRQPHSPMTVGTPQRQRMRADGKTSRAAEFYGALTGERGNVGERMLALNEAGANLRNLWVLGPEPYPQAHFATFVSEIPRRAILAGTSARGQCPRCGAPWRRDNQRENWHNNSNERVSVPPLQDDAAPLSVRPGQPQEGWSSALVSDVRCGSTPRDMDGKAGCGTGTGAAVSGDSPRGNDSPQTALSGNGHGPCFDASAESCIQANGTGQSTQSGTPASLSEDRAGASIVPDSRQPSTGITAERAGQVYTPGLGGDASPSAQQMPLLQEAVYQGTAGDDRPCNPSEQGGRPQPREHSSGVQAVQLSEVEPPNPLALDGWRPTCSCNAGPPQPQVVLDPFLGSGTSAFVARHHGRRAIGIELNESYARLAADRLKQGTLGLELW